MSVTCIVTFVSRNLICYHLFISAWCIVRNKVRKRTSAPPAPSFLRGAQRTKGARAESRSDLPFCELRIPRSVCLLGNSEEFPMRQKRTNKQADIRSGNLRNIALEIKISMKRKGTVTHSLIINDCYCASVPLSFS